MDHEDAGLSAAIEFVLNCILPPYASIKAFKQRMTFECSPVPRNGFAIKTATKTATNAPQAVADDDTTSELGSWSSQEALHESWLSDATNTDIEGAIEIGRHKWDPLGGPSIEPPIIEMIAETVAVATPISDSGDFILSEKTSWSPLPLPLSVPLLASARTESDNA